MQPNVITLVVDETNDGDTTADANHVYQRFEEFQNRSLYIGDNHSIAKRNTMALYRSFPKANANFRGVAKTSVKFTVDVEVLGADGVSTLTVPQICEVNFSSPVGTSDEANLLLRQKVLALLDRDDIMTPLNSTLVI